jgi:outer membrane receptor protein involved in Fe transport
VLRGPQGTLYGKNTTGGTISFYTADPTDQLGGKIEASVGNYDAYNLTGVLNVPLAEDLAARFVLLRSGHDPYNRSLVTGIGSAKDDTFYGRAKLKYSGERLTAVLSADFTDMDTGVNSAVFRKSSTFGTSAALEAAIGHRSNRHQLRGSDAGTTGCSLCCARCTEHRPILSQQLGFHRRTGYVQSPERRS